MTLGNTHDLSTQHHGDLLDTMVVIDGPIGPYLSGTVLHEVLDGLMNSGGAGGSGNALLYLIDDGTTYSEPGVRFQGQISGQWADYLGANTQGNAAVGVDYDGQVILNAESGNVFGELFAWDNDTGGLVDVFAEGHSGILYLDMSDSLQATAPRYVLEVTDTASTSKHDLTGGHGVVVPRLAADPSGGDSEEGQIYFNTNTNKFRGYDGTSWTDLN